MIKVKQIIKCLIVFLLLAQISSGQGTKDSCPLSLITHSLGDKLEERFNIVFKNFPKFIHYESIPLLCSKKEMKQLIDTLLLDKQVNGFRIHFGQDQTDSLRFVFVGTKDSFDVTPLYLYNSGAGKFESIKKRLLNDLTIRYNKTIQRFDFGLEEGNTTSYFFGRQQLNEIRKVFSELIAVKDIDYIGIHLGAYITCGGQLKCPETKDDLTNRLMLTFSFFKKNLSQLTEIYLEEINYCKFFIGEKATAGLDTGSPCPPKANCP